VLVLLTLCAVLLMPVGLGMVLVSVSWSLRPRLDRVGTPRLRKLVRIALGLSGAVILRAGISSSSAAAFTLGTALVAGVAIHAFANSSAPTPVARPARVRRTWLAGVACIAVSTALFTQMSRIAMWIVERDLGVIQMRTAPLVASLESFRAQRDRWPESREELLRFAGPHVADGLEDLRWRIDSSDVAESGLVVDYSTLLDFDYFVYAPRVEFSADLPAKRFGDWVYYNE